MLLYQGEVFRLPKLTQKMDKVGITNHKLCILRNNQGFFLPF